MTGTAGPEGSRERVWITVFSKIDDLLEAIKPQCLLYVEGTLKVRRDAQGDAFLHVNGELAEVLFQIDARPKALKGKAPYKDGKQGDLLNTGPAKKENASVKHECPFDDPIPF